MLFTSTLLALTGLSSALVAHPKHITPAFNSTLPHDLVDPTWIAHESMGLGNLTITGHHSVIAAKIAALKPSWQSNETHFNEIVARAEVDHLAKRSNRVNQYCFQPQFAAGYSKAARANSAYIVSHYGTGWCMQKAKSCSRWACNMNTAIVTCNDETTDSLFLCTTLQQNTLFLNSYCESPGDHYQVEGQAFYINPKYNVLVKGVDFDKWC